MQTMEIAEIFEAAVQNHEAGRLQQAEELYRQVLQIYPNHPAALHSLAVVALQRGEYNSAVELAGQAIKQMPQIAEFYNTIGNAFCKTGRFQEATDACRKAISLKPNYAEAYKNLAAVFQTQGQYDEAVENYRQVIRLEPNYAEVYYNLGIIFNKQKRFAEAIENYKRTIQLRPDCGEVHNDMAATLIWQGDFPAAIEECRQALSLKPDYAEAYNTMASAMTMQGHFDEAVENYSRAVQIAPDHIMAHFNMGIVLLLTGRFIEGWKEYEWRLKINNSIRRSPWDGSSFAGKRLLVCCEQGIGDSIQFVRYLPMVKERGGTVILQEKKPLLSLFQKLQGIDELVNDGRSDIIFDYSISLLSLPGIFATTSQTIPAKVPYIYVDPLKAEYWRSRLCGPGFKIGIVWAGASKYQNDHNRSCKPENFASLAKIDGVRLYSLQKGQRAAEAENLPKDMLAANPGPQFEDFTDTAAAIDSLDLIISVDTAVLHLAGAMGKPVWALLPFVPDWRWMLQRNDSPWYPTMKLFRQRNRGDWNELFGRVADELQKLPEGSGKK